MFCCPKNSEEEQKNKEIEKNLAEEKRKLAHTIKILILGAGESGKSTVMKQMRLYHESSFQQQELLEYKITVYRNIANLLVEIWPNLEDENGVVNASLFQDFPEVNRIMTKFLETSPMEIEFDESQVAELRILFKESFFRKALAKEDEELNKKVNLDDSAVYFAKHLDRVLASDYAPTEEDALHFRVKTIGVVETRIQTKDNLYIIIDVGGQRSERKKWFSCFDNVTAIIYVVSLSEYDQVMREDNTTNRTKESLELFNQMANNQHLSKCPLIVFFNKIDLFSEKVKVSPISNHFPEYQGGDDVEKATQYFVDMYLSVCQKPDRQVVHHLTCATDKTQVQAVIECVNEIIIQCSLKSVGLQ